MMRAAGLSGLIDIGHQIQDISCPTAKDLFPDVKWPKAGTGMHILSTSLSPERKVPQPKGPPPSGMVKGTPVNIIVGSHVWIEDPEEAWMDGEVTGIKGRDATIIITNGKTVVADISSIYPKDTEAPPAGVDDMTKLAYLHEPGVLYNLACRFALNEIYTYTGNILIAVNPFRRLPHLYNIHMMEQYKGAAFGELSPHLFAVADTCYRAMINDQGSQSILVSGESGAGKTETTKMLMRYLAFMGGRSAGNEGRTVEQQVLEDVERFKLGDPRTFHYLNQTNCYEVANVDDAREYLETRNAMDIVGISQDEQDAIFRIVAAILHLGNINFVKGKEVDSSKLKDDKSHYHLRTAAELLMCDEKALEDSLCKRVIVTPDGNITKPLDPASAVLSRDAMAKTVYSRLFDCFEQLCINLTNEKLQQHFNQHVFKMEQEEYTREEINWSYVEFVDNQDVLDLIEKLLVIWHKAFVAQKSQSQGWNESNELFSYKNHFEQRLSDEKSACVAILDRMGLTGYQIGKTKVFLRAGQMAELDARRAEVLANAVRRIQRQIRTYLTRKEFITLRRATIHLQKLWRAQLARKLYEQMRKEAASIRIQKNVRAHGARTFYTNLQASTIVIQTGMRAMAARNEYRYRRRTKAAIIIQHKIATLALQCLWRARTARKELRKLRMAARETGALKEAKDKLEKRVEELTWRLEFEKHLRLDLEEAKGQEIVELQSSLHEMQGQLDEAHAAIIREKEEAKLAIEQAPPVIKEVPVVDNTKLELLKNQNDELENELSELKKKMEEFENKCSELEKESKARTKEAEESHLKTMTLQDTIERLELNLSNLESENQVLRQQALDASENEGLSEELKILKSMIAELESENELLRKQPAILEQMTPEIILPRVKSFENGHGHQREEESQMTKESGPPISLLTTQRSLTDKQQENHDVLIKCLMEDKRFDETRPVAACVAYKTLLQWRSFEAEKATIFDKIIHTIRSSIESQDNITDLAYWLSSTSTLLYLLQNTLKASNTKNVSSWRNRNSPATLFGRMALGFHSSSVGMGMSSGYSGMVGKGNEQLKVEAKYPALLFKQHLTAYVEKIYGLIRDSVKKEIGPFLNLCIQAPRSIRGSSKNIHSSIVAKQQSSNIHWQSIVNKLDHTLGIMSENHVPPVFMRKIFSQVFSFINVQLFNSLLLRRECCSFSNGEYVKAGLQELEQWCRKASDQFAGSSWDELRHIRQAVEFLVSHQKAQKSLEEITNELCPMLSIPQIYRIGTMFWDDKYGTQGLSSDVISKMRTLMAADSIKMPNNTFLLDVDSSIPFSMEEIFGSLSAIRLSNMDPPPLLRQRSDFHFLLQETQTETAERCL
ncbi:hypothetical protein Peur_039287 [Populus x canadensis]